MRLSIYSGERSAVRVAQAFAHMPEVLLIAIRNTHAGGAAEAIDPRPSLAQELPTPAEVAAPVPTDSATTEPDIEITSPS